MKKIMYASYCKENISWDMWKTVEFAKKGAEDGDYVKGIAFPHSGFYDELLQRFSKKKIVKIVVSNEEEEL